jgi:hypothetical protein
VTGTEDSVSRRWNVIRSFSISRIQCLAFSLSTTSESHSDRCIECVSARSRRNLGVTRSSRYPHSHSSNRRLTVFGRSASSTTGSNQRVEWIGRSVTLLSLCARNVSIATVRPNSVRSQDHATTKKLPPAVLTLVEQSFPARALPQTASALLQASRGQQQ